MNWTKWINETHTCWREYNFSNACYFRSYFEVYSDFIEFFLTSKAYTLLTFAINLASLPVLIWLSERIFSHVKDVGLKISQDWSKVNSITAQICILFENTDAGWDIIWNNFHTDHNYSRVGSEPNPLSVFARECYDV